MIFLKLSSVQKFAILCLFILPTNSYAQVLGFDKSFNNNGIVLDEITKINEPRAMLITPENKVLLLVDIVKEEPFRHKYALIQYNQDGSKDESFGDMGSMISEFESGYWHIYGRMAISDDNIFVVYSPSNSPVYYIDKYDLSGKKDLAFGNGKGIEIKLADAQDVSCNSVKFDDNNRILFGGEFTTSNDLRKSIIIACNAEGKIMEEFGNEGKIISELEKSKTNSIQVSDDGMIYRLSSYVVNDYYDFSLARFHPDGSIDQSFGDKGHVKYSISNNNEILQDRIILKDSSIYISGQSAVQHVFLLKLDKNGLPAKDFGKEGLVTHSDFGDYNYFGNTDFQIYKNNIILCGNLADRKTRRVFILSCKPDGLLLNPNKNEGMHGIYDKSSDINFIESTIDQSGRLIIAGFVKAKGEANTKILLAAYDIKE